MNRIKILVLALSAAILSGGAFAADSYLYWMASDKIVNPLGGNDVEYSYVRVNYGGSLDADGEVTGGSWLSPYVDGVKSSGTAMTAAGAQAGASYWGDIGSYSSETAFIFELYNDQFELVGWNTLKNAESFLGTSSTLASGAYTLTTVVPEPTSGLLSLFGLAMLALRRRRRA